MTSKYELSIIIFYESGFSKIKSCEVNKIYIISKI